MPRRPHRPAPAPLETNDVLIAGVGTAAWMIALVVLLLIGLPPHARWWLWVCVTGIASGLFGMWYIPRLQSKRARVDGARERTHAADGRRDGDGAGDAGGHGRENGDGAASRPRSR